MKQKKKKIKLTAPSSPIDVNLNNTSVAVKKCKHCETTKTPQWRAGPMGPKTLCNACGVRYKSGRLSPEYRPAASPTFSLPSVTVVPFEARSFAESEHPTRKFPEPHAMEQKKNEIKLTAPSSPIDVNLNNTSVAVRKCKHCETTKTPQWRPGPMGQKTLCNACGVRFRSGRLFPEYRPAASPTFSPSLHSNSHKKVVQLRYKNEPVTFKKNLVVDKKLPNL